MWGMSNVLCLARLAIPAILLLLIGSGCSQLSKLAGDSNQERAEVLIQKAGKSFAESDLRKNADYLKEAAALDPHNRNVWWKLCEAYQLTEELDLAVKACEQQLVLNPSSSSHNGLGLVHLAKKDYARAASEFEKAAANSDTPAIHWNYVWALLCAKQYAKAVPASLRLLDLSKDIKEGGGPVPNPTQNAYEMLGVAYAGTGRQAEAQDAFSKAGEKSCEMGTDKEGDLVLLTCPLIPHV